MHSDTRRAVAEHHRLCEGASNHPHNSTARARQDDGACTPVFFCLSVLSCARVFIASHGMSAYNSDSIYAVLGSFPVFLILHAKVAYLPVVS